MLTTALLPPETVVLFLLPITYSGLITEPASVDSRRLGDSIRLLTSLDGNWLKGLARKCISVSSFCASG